MEKPVFFQFIKEKLGISFTELLLMLVLVSFITVEFNSLVVDERIVSNNISQQHK